MSDITADVDEVDQILAEWTAARPDLNLEPLAVFSRLTRIAKHLNRLRSQSFECSGLEVWEFDVLAVLRRSGPPFRVSTKTLVQATMVSSGTMTNRIDRLVSRRLVERFTDPNDGRGVLVEMTAEGRQRVDAALAHLVDAEAKLLATLSDAERHELAGLLRKLALAMHPGGA